MVERMARIPSTSSVKGYQSCLMPADSVKLSKLEQRVRSEGAPFVGELAHAFNHNTIDYL